MRLDGEIRYARLLKVLDAGKYGIKIETGRAGEGIETPGAEVVVFLTVVNNVKKPQTFRHLLLWREKWWHNALVADYGDRLLFHLESMEEARPRIRRAAEWVVKNIRLG